MRVVVLGISGCGKTTFATKLADATGVAQIELDLLNWRPGWVSRYDVDFDGLVRDLEKAMDARDWVVAGGYSKLREQTLQRADTVVWLDLPKPLILWQVFWRSLNRASTRRPMLNGNVETFSRWGSRGHPLQIVWFGFHRKRKQFEAHLAQPSHQRLNVFRCKSRREVSFALNTLIKSTKEPTTDSDLVQETRAVSST